MPSRAGRAAAPVRRHTAGREALRELRVRPASPSLLFDVGIHLVQEGVVGGISIRQTVAQDSAAKCNRSLSRRLKPAEKGDPLRGELTEIDRVAAIGAGDQRQGRIRPALLDRRLFEPHLAQPPDQIASAIPARHALVPSDRQIDAAARTDELFSDLRAGGTRPDNQYRAGWKLVGLLYALAWT